MVAVALGSHVARIEDGLAHRWVLNGGCPDGRKSLQFILCAIVPSVNLPDILLSTLFTLALSLQLANAAASGVCTQAPYSPFLALSNYPPAESYCSSVYPIAKQPASHKRVKAKRVRARNAKTTSKTTSSPAKTNSAGQAALWSSLEA